MLDIPFNAILICYGPLAVVVLGFIFFAVLTDVNARRSYLRRSLVTEPVTMAFNAETPSGAKVLIRPAGVQPTAIEEVKAPPELPQTDTPVVEAEVVDDDEDMEVVEPAGVEDDLSLILGMGPKTIEALRAAGITTFEQVAAMTGEQLEEAVRAQGGRVVGNTASTWPRQAELLQNGDMDGLRAYQDEINNS
jgi:predicted flap endonuclease-1-like 5' DNA nuclease